MTTIDRTSGEFRSILELYQRAPLLELADQASAATGVSRPAALEYLSGLDYGLRYEHLAGLTTFFGKLAASGRVPNGSLVFLPAA